MITQSFVTLGFILFSAVPFVSYSAPLPNSKILKETTHVYLSKKDINVQEVLPPPPALGSEQSNIDYQTILNLQNTRTPQECNRASAAVDASFEVFFGPATGILTESEVEKLNLFFYHIYIDSRYFVKKGKNHFQRLRPYKSNVRVVPCVELEESFAYPSGHSTVAWVYYRVLELIDPERASIFRARATELGDDRVLAGVHHPSDIHAGRMLGDVIFEKLMNNSKFVEDLKNTTID